MRKIMSVAAYAALVNAAYEADRVPELPLMETFPFPMYSGYLTVGADSGAQKGLHYMFA